MEPGLLTLVVLGVTLGLRHGIDWDHIAAITDITSSTPASVTVAAGVDAPAGFQGNGVWDQGRRGFALATMYAAGHATLVVVLGLLAIWASTLLPEWLDPIMERIVGLTLVVLGVWVFYAIWRDGRSFRLRSRWMLVFALLGRSWEWARGKLTGHPASPTHSIQQYGRGTAYTVGVIHGIGAETGSQALLLAGAAGATSPQAGTLMLVAFTVGLLISNSLVAAVSAFGFISAQVRQRIYVAIGLAAGCFSLVVGWLFLTGQGGVLPDLQDFLSAMLGSPSEF